MGNKRKYKFIIYARNLQGQYKNIYVIYIAMEVHL